MPPSVTLVGVQNDNTVIPVRREGRAMPIAVYGNATTDSILNELAGNEGVEDYYIRIACGCSIALGMLVLKGCYIPFHVSAFIRDHL